jgi:hypothetical protein
MEMTDNKSETEVMREHIVWLGSELMKTQAQLTARNNILQDMLNPDVMGWSIPHEVRSTIYNLFSQEREEEAQAWNRK